MALVRRQRLVTRHVTPSVPVRVDYALTTLSRGLLSNMQGIEMWAEDNLHTVHTDRHR